MISTEAAKEIGETERSKLVNTELEWPDCGTVTRNIIEQIRKHHDTQEMKIKATEFQINNEYYHYVTEIIPTTTHTDPLLIDASFSQFATETDTPISINTIDVINPVCVVKPNTEYIFYPEKTNTYNTIKPI